MPLAFSNKAGTLVQLQGKLQSSRIPSLVCFSLADWRHSREALLQKVVSEL